MRLIKISELSTIMVVNSLLRMDSGYCKSNQIMLSARIKDTPRRMLEPERVHYIRQEVNHSS